ncbi:hypothetical protein [Rickettsia endosymbiont of Urophora cardui]|uniref:hypothetical protein n=1 Tax=Rickettsia endosymbiont of Urophora cardui TaxID=3066265 RepID=UPI00313CD083
MGRKYKSGLINTGIYPIQNWKKQFLGNAALAFEPAKVLSEYQEQINHLQEQNDELAKALGRITVERDWGRGKAQKLAGVSGSVSSIV